jgi:DNA-binding MarR family transcriptional regulator
MKTAMQELIEILEDKNHLSNPRNNQDDIDTYLHCRDEAKELLEKEKEQIMNAFSRGLGTELSDWETSEQYYERIYNQNK